jgi:hypothetical protein
VPPSARSSQQQPDVQALAQAIREATEAEVEELAPTLLATVDATSPNS